MPPNAAIPLLGHLCPCIVVCPVRRDRKWIEESKGIFPIAMLETRWALLCGKWEGCLVSFLLNSLIWPIYGTWNSHIRTSSLDCLIWKQINYSDSYQAGILFRNAVTFFYQKWELHWFNRIAIVFNDSVKLIPPNSFRWAAGWKQKCFTPQVSLLSQ